MHNNCKAAELETQPEDPWRPQQQRMIETNELLSVNSSATASSIFDHAPYCMPFNEQEEEIVKHHLLDCSALKDLGRNLIPLNSNTNIMYKDKEQLKKTCALHYLAQEKKSENL